jgi:hypothetical protein
MNIYEETLGLLRIDAYADFLDLDARFPHGERLLDVVVARPTTVASLGAKISS